MQTFARSILETVRHPLLVLDAELRVVASNAPFYASFATTAGEVLARPLDQLGGRQWDLPPLRALLQQVIRTGEAFDGYTIEYTLPDRGRRQLVLNARVVHQDDNHSPRVLLAIEDETEKILAAEALQRLKDQLEQRVAERTADLALANESLRKVNRELETANRELESFCYSVSHDLRAPLRAMNGFSQELLASHSECLNPDGQHYLRRIRAATQRMGQLIDDLLKLSRVSRAELQPEVVDMGPLAQSIIEEMQQQEPERKVIFQTREGLLAWCDRRLIRLLLENLLGNAWKFTSHQPEARIEFDQTDAEGSATFFVRDNGAGFDSRFAARLFGAFQRLHSEREFPGTGIGLATVQRIIHRHGGTVWGDGVPGRGATFHFTLPDTRTSA